VLGKSKRNTYLLLAAVIVIWGLLIFRLFNPENEDDLVQASPMDTGPAIINKIKPKDTFSIRTYDRDPFLGTIQKKEKPKKRVVRPQEIINWPSVIYKGLVAGNQAKDNVYILEINGNQYLMKRNTTENEITLLQGKASQVIVRYKKQRKTIGRQQ